MPHKEATPEWTETWKKTAQENRGFLAPNRKTGTEIVEYLKAHYLVTPIDTDKAKNVVMQNIMENEPFRKKLPPGQLPEPVTFLVGGEQVFAGIDLATGYFCVEGSQQLYDELFAFRGLDETDLESDYLVAEYVRCKQMAESRAFLKKKMDRKEGTNYESNR